MKEATSLEVPRYVALPALSSVSIATAVVVAGLTVLGVWGPLGKFWPAQFALTVAVVAVLAKRPSNGDWLAPQKLIAALFLIYFVAIPVVLRFATQFSTATSYYFRRFRPDFLDDLWILAVANLACFLLFLLGYGSRAAKRVGERILSGTSWRYDDYTVVFWLYWLILIGAGSYLVYVTAVGGLGYVVTHQDSRTMFASRAGMPGIGWFFWATKALWWAGLLVFAFRYNRRFPVLSGLLFLGVVLAFWALGGRGQALLPVLLLFLLHADDLRQGVEPKHVLRQLVLKGAPILIAILALAALFGVLRSGGLRGAEAVTSLQVARSGFSTFNRLDIVLLTIDKLPQDHAFLFGETLAAPFLFFVREIGIPIQLRTAPQFLTELLFPPTSTLKTGVGAPLIAELYLNFGWIGLVGFSVLGGLLRVLYQVKEKNRDNPLVRLTYVYWLMILIWNVPFTSGFSGSFHKAFITFVVLAIPAVLLSVRSKAEPADGPFLGAET